jgi:hypothetical protein
VTAIAKCWLWATTRPIVLTGLGAAQSGLSDYAPVTDGVLRNLSDVDWMRP